MAEEFKSYQNTEADEDRLKLTLDEEPAPQEDLSVTGKPKSHKKKKSKLLYPLLIVLLLGVMGYSGYQIAATYIRNLKADQVYSDIENQFLVDVPPQTEAPGPAQTKPAETRADDEPEESLSLMTVEADPETTAPDPMRLLNVDFDSLKKANGDAVAWLQGLEGHVSYPVVQGKDNSYYLTHLFDGTVNKNGTLFVHCDNNFLQDDITYIFGHHMKSGKMFGHLTDYRSREYYNNNQELRLYTPETIYTLKPFAVVLGVGTEQITLNYAGREDFNRGIQGYISRSLHPASVSVSYGDKLVCLCTCSHLQDDGRLFVYCKVMNQGE